jgi:hypothetical protein
MSNTNAPLRSKMLSEAFYRDLDPGIRFAVRILHAHGFDTCQSCQGGKGHAYYEPTVEMAAASDDAEGFGALAALQAYGLPVAAIALTWPVKNGVPYEKNWRITFHEPMEDRANDKPIFIWGYQAQ